MDIFPPSKQRPALLEFARTCCTRADKLRRDDCGDWAICGNTGHIYATPVAPDGKGGRGLPAKTCYQLMIFCDSPTGWTWAKKRLSFGDVTQNGDCEGSIILDRLPTQAEAVEVPSGPRHPQADRVERRGIGSQARAVLDGAGEKAATTRQDDSQATGMARTPRSGLKCGQISVGPLNIAVASSRIGDPAATATN